MRVTKTDACPVCGQVDCSYWEHVQRAVTPGDRGSATRRFNNHRYRFEEPIRRAADRQQANIAAGTEVAVEGDW